VASIFTTKVLTTEIKYYVREGPKTVTWPNFGTPLYFEYGLSYKRQNGHADSSPGGLTEEKQEKVKCVQKGSRDQLWKFRDPLHVGGTVGGWKVKFGRQIESGGPNESNIKLRQRGAEEVTWRNFELLAPLHISGAVGVGNFKFGVSKLNDNMLDDQ